MTTTLDREGTMVRLTAADLEPQLERHRRELTSYCRRMLGSTSEAEDAVQETLVRAWRGLDRFEGRSALRSWLYSIAANVCVDMQRWPQRRARPVDLSPTNESDALPGGVASPAVAPDPADEAVASDTVRRAFAAALQHLPPRQRAVLILREVLRWKAAEVAELLGASVPSVNSLLQRARVTVAAALGHEPGRGYDDGGGTAVPPLDDTGQQLLGRYVDAFGRADVTSLVALLHEDAAHSN
jgi:RNA polymerase sigma-70 factor, ECF subfamily